jgi:hypothetical protein
MTAMKDQRSRRWLVWLVVGVVLLPALAADLGLVSLGGDLSWLAVLAGLAVVLGFSALIAYSREDVGRRPLACRLAGVCACAWLASPIALLTWPDGAVGSGPLFFTSGAAMLLAIFLVWPLCLFDCIVKRAWMQGLLGLGVLGGAFSLSGLLVSWIAEWKGVTFRD